MSELNKNAWPFGEDTSSEGLDFGAIFGSGSAPDVNPFDAQAAQAAEPAASPAPAQTAETPAQAPQSGTATETSAQAEQPNTKAKTPKVPAAVQGSVPAAPVAEGGDLISAAFAKQEKAEEQAKVKSIFEKAPVFSYGSAKEDITDPAQTFEELRIAKSDDFPELSEGKRVSWSVEYGKVTKAITDPKGTTIRSVKEEIEKSKAFLDGLKKAKDKNPDCLVKPRVTAQSKGTASYKGVYRTLEEARASEKPICLIPAGDGKVYELRKTELGEFIAPKDKVVEFPQIRTGFTPALPLIPMELLQRIISFFRCYMGEVQEFEALAHILWDKEDEVFTVYVPKQEVSKARVDADLSQAGGSYRGQDGWCMDGYPGCDYLYFLLDENGNRTFLYANMENDCEPGDELFHEDLLRDLEAGGFLTPPEESAQKKWQTLSTDAETFDLSISPESPNFVYVFNHADTVPLDQLVAFSLESDGAYTEGAVYELRVRFLEAPDTVLMYLALLEDQTTEYNGREISTAERICNYIASADAAWYDGSEEFAETMEQCRKAYPEGRIAELLDILEEKHAASMERHSPNP